MPKAITFRGLFAESNGSIPIRSPQPGCTMTSSPLRPVWTRWPSMPLAASFYGLEEASQDVYLGQMIEKAIESGEAIRTERMCWAEGK